MTADRSARLTHVRSALGRVGVRNGAIVRQPAAALRQAAATIEDMGYRALWFPETQDVFAQAGLLLAATTDLVVCSSIANIHARDPIAAGGGANALAEAYDGRFVLGLGASHRPMVERRGHSYSAPLATMRAYLEAMDQSPVIGAPAAMRPTRLLGALGPAMLELSGSLADGAHPYCVPVEHTAIARKILGPEPLLCVELAVSLTDDRAAALEGARRYLDVHLGLDNYRNNLIRLGWRDDQINADSMFDVLIAWGDESQITQRVQAHLDAGADHVCIQPMPTDDVGLDMLRALAPSVLAL